MLNIDLKNKNALVTGCTQGVGLGISKMLAKAGCNIIGCATKPADDPMVIEFLRAMESEGAKAFYQSVNVTEDADLVRLTEFADTKLGSLDILVSNAGKNVFEGVENCSDDDWEFNHRLNLRAHWKLAKLFKYLLLKSENPVIQIITSNHAYQTLEGCFPYNVTKTALTGLVRAMAIDWGPEIRTVGIAPGFVDTTGNQKWFDGFDDPEKIRKETVALHPAGKIATAEEVGVLSAFLASDYASFITGNTILMDGGRSAILQDILI